MSNKQRQEPGSIGGVNPREVNRRAMGEASAFHNPYTFMPFSGSKPSLSKPTLLTADEESGDKNDPRFTGIIELEIKTLSPLLTANPDPRDPGAEHKAYGALKVGEDVILPATGVRGMLRSLLTMLMGAALTTLDAEAYLCQGRDARLGPRGKSGGQGVPDWVFLGRVVEPGNRFRDGKIELVETDLVKLEDLEKLARQHLPGVKLDSLRPTSEVAKNQRRLFIDNPGGPKSIAIAESPSVRYPWEVRLSGRPVRVVGKREGAFRCGGLTLKIPSELWLAYTSRHRHAVRPELRAGDLVWLEPTPANLTAITCAGQIKSLQWARWGREGQAAEGCLPEHVLPDYRDPDGAVGEVTDLFGLVSPERESSVSPFAGRIRPENLVFQNVAGKVETEALAPLSAPHPGCVAFYRKIDGDEHKIPRKAELRGYKIYRTTKECGQHAPWLYATQGIYGETGELKPVGKISKTVELVPEGSTGSLNIAVRGLSRRELALLIQACSVPWRLGGGKSLGLGLCEVTAVRVIGEMGDKVDLAALKWEREVVDIKDRVDFWKQSQMPVEKLRYPRAAGRNANKISRGGHVWFQRHAALRKVEPDRDGKAPENFDLQGRMLGGKARAEAGSTFLPAQTLPSFDPANPLADVLYGYDVVAGESDDRVDQARPIISLDLFDPALHLTGGEQSGGNTSQNRDTRQAGRAGRAAEAPPAPPKPPALEKDRTVEAVLVGEKTKAGGWKARHEGSGMVGPIQNSGGVPGDAKPGDKLELLVTIYNGREVAFKFPTEKEKADATKRLAAKAAHHGHNQDRRRY